jgi:hypothetical protein
MTPFNLALLIVVATASSIDIIDLYRYVGNSSFADPMPVVLSHQQVQDMLVLLDRSSHEFRERQFMPYTDVDHLARQGEQRMARLFHYLYLCEYRTTTCNQTSVMPMARPHMWFFAMNPYWQIDQSLSAQFVEARRCSVWPLERPPWAVEREPADAALCSRAYLSRIQAYEDRCTCTYVPWWMGAPFE